jgi:hypothetical protein
LIIFADVNFSNAKFILNIAAVSEPDNNIFERLILNEVNKDYKEEDEQLGFKTNSSFSHAIFVVIQMINICKQRNKHVMYVHLIKLLDQNFG